MLAATLPPVLMAPGVGLSPAAAETPGTITTVAGNGTSGFRGDGGPATAAQLWHPAHMSFDTTGNHYIADYYNNRVRRVDTQGVITTVAGNGSSTYSGDGGEATAAGLGTYIQGVTVDAAGNLYVSSNAADRVRRVDTNGVISTVVPYVDGPDGLTLDRTGRLYISELYLRRVVSLSAQGVLGPFAGKAYNGGSGFGGDGGPAIDAYLAFPKGMSVDDAGSIYIADQNNNRIRTVGTDGIIRTVAGSGATGYTSGSFSGDGGPATSATMNKPYDVVVDRAGNYFIADNANSRIRKVDTRGVITTIAGTGKTGFSGDGGPATAANLGRPEGVALDYDGNLYVTTGERVRRIAGVAEGGPVGGGIGPTEVLGGLGGRYTAHLNCAVRNRTKYPVTTSTGNFWHTFDDLAVPGRGIPLNLHHTYNSAMAGTDGPLGWGWTHSYAMRLSTDPVSGAITVHQETGSTATFKPVGASYVAPPRVRATLVKEADGRFTFTRQKREIFTFDAAGQLTTQKDLNGYTTTLSRPDAQTLVITDPTGRSFTLSHTAGRLTSATDSASPPRTVGFSYDGDGNLAEVVDVNGGRTRFAYDGSHRMVTMREPKYASDTTTTPAPVVTNHYDSSGRVDWQSDPLGRTTTFDYTSVPGSTKITDPKGNVELHTYRYGTLRSETFGYGTPQAATRSYSYDPWSLGCTSTTDSNGHRTRAYYDAGGNRLRVIDPLGRTTHYTYDALDNLTTARDPSGITTTYAYDTAGNLLSRSRPLLDANGSTLATQTTAFYYHENGNPNPGEVTSMVDPNGKRWVYGYDAHGMRNAVTDPLGHKTTSVYDAVGRKTSETSPKGNVPGADPAQFTTAFTHDPDGLLRRVIHPLGHGPQYRYDANRNRDQVIDGEGHTTNYDHDPANQLTKVTRGDGTALRNDYWGDGSLHRQWDGANRATTYYYDPLGQVSAVTDPNQRVTRYGYDPGGNLTSLAEPGGSCTAIPKVGCTTRTYDVANQLKTITYSDGTTPNVTNVDYDANGQRTAVADGTGTSTWHWDSLGRLTASTTGAGVAGGGQSVSYGYDLAGHLISLTYPGNLVLTRHFDDAGRLDWLEDWLGNRTNFGYDDNDNLTTRTLPAASAVSSTDTYDRADRLMALGVAKGTTSLASFSYGRNNADLVSSVTTAGMPTPENNSYGYTALNQLESVNAATYDYDAADNLIRLASGATQAYDAASQLCWVASSPGTSCASPPEGATTFGYDSRGNRTSMAGPRTWDAYSYDQANRLTEAPMPLTSLATGTDAVDGGGSHSVALKADGTVLAWGANTSGQLGNGTTTSNVPVPVSGLGDIVAVSAGERHSLALKADGTVWAWGANASGQLGNGTTNHSSLPVMVLTGATRVSAGRSHSLAVKNDGTVWAWGENSFGQLGDGTTTSSTVPVRAGPGGPLGVGALSGVSEVAAGASHSLASTADGDLYAWGGNDYGQLGNGTTANTNAPIQVAAARTTGGMAPVTRLAAGDSHTLALKGNGAVLAWGRNNAGQLGNSSQADSAVPVQVSGLTAPMALSAGSQHSLARLSDGTAAAWGANTNGQLGDDSTNARHAPQLVPGPAGATAVAAGSNHTLAITARAGKSWGLNASGQLGDGTTTDRRSPVAVAGTPATYAYNGDGLRMAKTVNDAATAFTWDHSGDLPQLLTEGTGTATTKYIYGPDGLPLEQIDASGNVLFYHHDQIGSTRLLTDAAGAVVATATYDAYGNRTASSGPVPSLGFAGQYTDGETGFQYLRARYYDPATGQFLTRDPRVAQSGQPYAYANNSPHNFTDPTGEIAWLAVAAVAWAAFEVGSAVVDAVSTAKTLADPCASGLDKFVSGGLFAVGAIAPGGGYSTGARGLSSRAARRQAMREQGIPTSQQPTSQLSTNAGYQYTYDVPDVGGGTRRMVVTQQTTDRVQGHGPHWEAGPVKLPEYPERLDPLGRLRVDNTKSKVNYVE